MHLPSNFWPVAISLWIVALTTLLVFWKRTAIRLKLEKKLSVMVKRDPALAPQRRGLFSAGLLPFLDLDQDALASGPLSSMQLLPLRDYFASLIPEGTVSWERAVVSVADRFGLAAALPLALFLPNRWRTEAAAGGLLRCFPSLVTATIVTTAISTLDMVAFSQTAHLYAARRRRAHQPPQGDAAERVAEVQQAQQARAGPLDILLAGCKQRSTSEGAGREKPLPSPFILTRSAVLVALGLTPAEAADATLLPAPPPKPLSLLLPGLHLGNGGLTLTHSRGGAAICGLMAVVLNRLTANALAGLAPAAELLQQCQKQQQQREGRSGGEAPFVVRLREGGPLLGSVEALLRALRDEGHEVQLQLSSNLTSFGVGLSVQGADGSWQQVPLAYPLRCSGLWAHDEEGRQQDVLTLVSHASIILTVRGPQLDFEAEWCLSIAGFTGWLPYVSVKREWASGDGCKVAHPLGDTHSSDQQARLARLLTAATCVLNLAAQRDALLFGGYGHVGVCVDSVAAIQQAVCGTCTLFPLVLGGEAKLGLMALYKRGREQGWEYGDEAAALQEALAALPCDAIQGPRTAAEAARRALACLPPATPFAAVGVCRKTLQAALEAASELCPSD